jgi:hypothetical protein
MWGTVIAQPPAPKTPQSVARNTKPSASSVPAELNAEHPLSPLLVLARQRQEYVRNHIQDFSCRLIKRERIDGELQDYRYIDLLVREPRRGEGQSSRPLGVLMSFLAPAQVAGRKILYVAGENDDKMLVRKGGRRLSYLVVSVDPCGASARNESQLPITASGYNDLLAGMIKSLERQMEADPAGANTRVQQIARARVNDRACSVIRIIHPKQQPELSFHLIDVFLDAQFHLPVRVAAYDWPNETDDAPALLAEYSYVDLQFNQNPSDARFDRQALGNESGRDSKSAGETGVESSRK